MFVKMELSDHTDAYDDAYDSSYAVAIFDSHLVLTLLTITIITLV